MKESISDADIRNWIRAGSVPVSLEATAVVTSRSRVRVKILGAGVLADGCCFFDPYERTVEHHIVPHMPYATYVEAEGIRIDLDAQGRPVFVEVSGLPRGMWSGEPLVAPSDADVGEHRLLDFPVRFGGVRISACSRNKLIHIAFSDNPVVHRWMSSGNAIWEADRHCCLTSLWLLNAESDVSGRGRAAWRAEAWQRFRLAHKAGWGVPGLISLGTGDGWV